jgi:hypothetical protein
VHNLSYLVYVTKRDTYQHVERQYKDKLSPSGLESFQSLLVEDGDLVKKNTQALSIWVGEELKVKFRHQIASCVNLGNAKPKIQKV